MGTSRKTLLRQKKTRENLGSKNFLPLWRFILKKQEKDTMRELVHAKAWAIRNRTTGSKMLQQEMESSKNEESFRKT
jgi:hypothetical protein